MSWILITNDDGMDSPALPPLIGAIGRLASVEVVVPNQERSWIGKAITRHDPVTVQQVERGGREIAAASGYPADCVQLGIHALFPNPPALVVSGINIGYNHGAGYIQSSGTVGGAIEAFLGGVPAIALSAGSHSRPWAQWRDWVHTPEAATMWERLAGIAADLIGRLLAVEPPGAVVNVTSPTTPPPTQPAQSRQWPRSGTSSCSDTMGTGATSTTSAVGCDGFLAWKAPT